MRTAIVAGMRKGFSVSFTPVILAALSLCWLLGGAGARGSDLEAEYAQVRKIALKDPRVQEAFAKANDRLNQRILEIDPSLKPIVDRQSRMPAPAATPVLVNRRAVETPRAAPVAPVAQGREHIVVSGETLDSIAHHYKVRVATLERVNHITDARKLQVGQKLMIPVSENAVAAPAPEPSAQPAAQPTARPAPAAAASAEATPDNAESLWDKLKSGL